MSLRFDVDIGAVRLAVFVELVAGLEARESLRARGRADDRAAVVRGGLAGFDLIVLLARLDAEREVDALRAGCPRRSVRTMPALKTSWSYFMRARVEAGLRSGADTRC